MHMISPSIISNTKKVDHLNLKQTHAFLLGSRSIDHKAAREERRFTRSSWRGAGLTHMWSVQCCTLVKCAAVGQRSVWDTSLLYNFFREAFDSGLSNHTHRFCAHLDVILPLRSASPSTPRRLFVCQMQTMKPPLRHRRPSPPFNTSSGPFLFTLLQGNTLRNYTPNFASQVPKTFPILHAAQ